MTSYGAEGSSDDASDGASGGCHVASGRARVDGEWVAVSGRVLVANGKSRVLHQEDQARRFWHIVNGMCPLDCDSLFHGEFPRDAASVSGDDGDLWRCRHGGYRFPGFRIARECPTVRSQGASSHLSHANYGERRVSNAGMPRVMRIVRESLSVKLRGAESLRVARSLTPTWSIDFLYVGKISIDEKDKINPR